MQVQSAHCMMAPLHIERQDVCGSAEMLYKEQLGIRKLIPNHVGGALEAMVSQGAELLGQATGSAVACSFNKTADMLEQMPCDGSHGTPEQKPIYTPGKHRIKKTLKMSDGPALGGPGGETFVKVNPGTIVDVLKVVHCADLNRVRACIKQPRGWITLQDLSTDDCYAEEVYVQVYSSEGHDTVSLYLQATGALEAWVPNGTLLALAHEDSDMLVVIYDGKRCSVAKHDCLSSLSDALCGIDCES